jgi:hypothetical protein
MQTDYSIQDRSASESHIWILSAKIIYAHLTNENFFNQWRNFFYKMDSNYYTLVKTSLIIL